MKSIDIHQLAPEVFRMFSVNNALLTAGDRETCNTMTIGWGQLGTIWGLPVCTVYVRPERYTYRFMEEKDSFSVSILAGQARDVARVCGTKSGRDLDKFAACGLTVAYGAGDTPYVESELVLVCKKLYAQDMSGDHLTDQRPSAFYTEKMGNWHRCYIGEIVEAYIK